MIIDRMAVSPPVAEQVIDLDGLADLQRTADAVFVDRSVAQYAVDLVQATRTPAKRSGSASCARRSRLGASPRASLDLVTRRPGAGPDPRPHVRHAAGRLRHRPRGAAPPPAADLRRARPRHHHRTRRQPDARDGAGDVGVAEAERQRPWAEPMVAPASRSHRADRVEWPTGPPTEQVTELVRTLELTITRRLDGALHGNHQGITPGPRQRAGRVPAVPAGRRRAPHRLERHRPHPARPTSATRSPTATSRRGWSSTCRRRCASARRRPRRRRSRSSPPRPSGSSPRATRTASAPCSSPARSCKVMPPRFGTRPGARRSCQRRRRRPPSEGLGRADLAGAIDRVAVRQQAARLRRRDLRLRRRPTGSTRSPGSACATTCWRSRSTIPASSTCRRSGSSQLVDPSTGRQREVRVTAAVQRASPTAAAEEVERAAASPCAAPAPTLIELATDERLARRHRQPRHAAAGPRPSTPRSCGDEPTRSTHRQPRIPPMIAVDFLAPATTVVAARRRRARRRLRRRSSSGGAGPPCASPRSTCSTRSRRHRPGWRRHVVAGAAAARPGRRRRRHRPAGRPRRPSAPRQRGPHPAAVRRVAVDGGHRRPAEPARRGQGGGHGLRRPGRRRTSRSA